MDLLSRITTTGRPYSPPLPNGRCRLTRSWSEFLSRIDGEGGFAVIETDNQAGLLDGVSKFTTWLQFEIVPVVDIMDGVAVLAAGADFRESV